MVKKRHTIKSLVISDAHKYIHYISEAYIGCAHDYSILKKEFPPDQPWFRNYEIQLDLGFLGFDKLYEVKTLEIPFKRSKYNQLTAEQKKDNKAMSSQRVKVEHAIGGLKRYRILADRLRCHDYHFYNEVLGICAGLWNYWISS